MKKAWATEYTRIIILSAAALLLGVVSGEWLLAVLLSTLTYIIWTLYQIRSFERWIRAGAKSGYAPDANGIWEVIVQHIYRSQRKIKQRKERLEFLANRFESIISALADATLVLNEQDEIEWGNEAAEQLLGVKVPQDLGQRVDNLIRCPQLQKMLKKKKGKTVEITSPIDASKTISLSYSAFNASQQLLIARDVSEQVAVNKLRKSFVTNASHELRTPLSVVSGYLEMLEEDKALPKNMYTPVKSAHQQACRMQKILDELLYLSRLEIQSHQDDEGEWLDMGTIVSQLVADFDKTKSKGLREFKLDMDDVKLLAVETEIFSLCQNLLSNAFKYSPDTSPISISWKENEHGYGCLSVIDQGEGIAAKDISRITERFYRVDVARSRKVGGTGLGLSIVRHIIESHGGRIEVQSELGKGSTFKACFPPYRLPR